LPISDARVELVRRRPPRPATHSHARWSEQPYLGTRSDAQGRFGFEALPAVPDHTVRAHRLGSGWVIRAPIAVVAGERRAVELVLQPDIIIRGRVHFPSGAGKPRWRTVLGLVLANADGAGDASTETHAREPVHPDETGRFEIVASNAHRVVVDSLEPGTDGVVARSLEPDAGFAGATLRDVQADAAGLHLTLSAGR
jgi:hypothetical protein